MTTLAEPISADCSGLPRLLGGTEREAAMDRLSVGFNALSSSKRAFLRAAWILRRQGVLVVRQAVPPPALDAINAEVNQLLAQLDAGQTKTTGLHRHPQSAEQAANQGLRELCGC